MTTALNFVSLRVEGWHLSPHNHDGAKAKNREMHNGNVKKKKETRESRMADFTSLSVYQM